MMGMGSFMLAERTSRVSASPTQQVMVDSERLRSRGVDVVDLGAGEPDFTTPSHAKAAAVAAIEADFTKYTPNSGIGVLKEAIGANYKAAYDVEYGLNEIIVTAGGKQGLFNAILTLFGPGDEVITHAPGWPTVIEQIKLAEASPVAVRTYPEEGFRVRAETILEAITSRTRGVVLNSPGNPTGALIQEDDLRVIADELSSRDIWVLVDLCYEQLIYDQVSHNLPLILDERMRDRTVLVGTASKTYAMTGWRCGWVLGPSSVIASCNAIQSHSTSNVCSIAQKAAVAVLNGPQDCVGVMVDEYRQRRDDLTKWLSKDKRFRFVKPAGAFYLFPDISELLSPTGIRTSVEFARSLLNEGHVGVTAGEAFDSPGFIRMSYATSADRLREGVNRIMRFVEALDQ